MPDDRGLSLELLGIFDRMAEPMDLRESFVSERVKDGYDAKAGSFDPPMLAPSPLFLSFDGAFPIVTRFFPCDLRLSRVYDLFRARVFAPVQRPALHSDDSRMQPKTVLQFFSTWITMYICRVMEADRGVAGRTGTAIRRL